MVHIKENYHRKRITTSLWMDPFKNSRKPVTQHVIPLHICGADLDYPSAVKEGYSQIEVMPITSYLENDNNRSLGNGIAVKEEHDPHIKPSKHGHVWYVRHKENNVASGATDYVKTYDYTVSDGQIVYLKALGHSWFPNTDFKIEIDDKIFADYDYQWGDPDALFKFPEGSQEVRKHIKFFVKNRDTSNHDYDCVFSGWVESVVDVKK